MIAGAGVHPATVRATDRHTLCKHGVLAAGLVRKVEHVGSVVLGLVIAAVPFSIGVIVSQRLRANIDDVTDDHEGLRHITDEQSRQAESQIA
jgi:hypothetical protein